MSKDSSRFTTLDVFRGITVFLMIIVNTPGSGSIPFSPLLHANWDGCTLTDLVFPSFLFAAGNSMAFSKTGYKGRGEIRTLARIIKRAAIIFVIGYLLTWYCTIHWNTGNSLEFGAFENNRVMAVLQRIALAYGIGGIMIHLFPVRTVVVLSVIFLLGYWLVLMLAGDPGSALAPTGNAVRKLDLLILGERHMYRENGVIFDPEGLLGTIPATVSLVAGYLAAVFIVHTGKNYECVAKLCMAGSLVLLAGLAWDQVFPINKKLWTSSYVLYTTGIFLIALSILLYTIEMRNWKRGISFFLVFGKNPLAIYILSNLLIILLIMHIPGNGIFYDWINKVFFQQVAPGPVGSLLFALSFTLFCWAIGWLMHKRNIFIRV